MSCAASTPHPQFCVLKTSNCTQMPLPTTRLGHRPLWHGHKVEHSRITGTSMYVSVWSRGMWECVWLSKAQAQLRGLLQSPSLQLHLVCSQLDNASATDCERGTGRRMYLNFGALSLSISFTHGIGKRSRPFEMSVDTRVRSCRCRSCCS